MFTTSYLFKLFLVDFKNQTDGHFSSDINIFLEWVS